jgi:hypothetical protein
MVWGGVRAYRSYCGAGIVVDGDGQGGGLRDGNCS